MPSGVGIGWRRLKRHKPRPIAISNRLTMCISSITAGLASAIAFRRNSVDSAGAGEIQANPVSEKCTAVRARSHGELVSIKIKAPTPMLGGDGAVHP